MRKLIFLLGVVAVAMLVPTSIAAGHVGRDHGDRGGHSGDGWHNGGDDQGGDDQGGDHHHRFVCSGTFTQITVRNLVVPQSGVCLITNSVISGSVDVPIGGVFEAGTTRIGEDVVANDAETVYIYAGSTVRGDIETEDTAQTQIFDSTVKGDVNVRRGTDQIYLCNDAVDRGISVRQSGPNILVGDHLNPHCPGNVVREGDISVAHNATYVELVVGDNSVPHGSIFVNDNLGTPVFTSGESVQGNHGGGALLCQGNAPPFIGSPNPGWSRYAGQCSA